MKLATKLRLLFWTALLAGGTGLSLYLDRNDPRLFDPLYHLLTALLAIPVLYISFKAATIGGKTLAKYGKSPDTPRLETDKLVTQGIYSCMRHPMLFGLALFPLGIALFLGLPSFIWPISIIEGLVIGLLTLTYEEKDAVKKFGDDYIAYKNRVKAFELSCFLRYLFNL